MARPKEFDTEKALNKAMEVFWSRGFEASSVDDLVKHMGINRQSLYDTFGDKNALYLRALDRYRNLENKRIFELLQRPGSVRQNLRHVFDETIDRALRDRQKRGCFIGNAMSERAGRCRETTDRACNSFAATEEAFYSTLLRGKKDGEIKRSGDLRAVARFLYCNLQGLALLAKATQDRKTLEDIVRVTLSVVH